MFLLVSLLIKKDQNNTINLINLENFNKYLYIVYINVKPLKIYIIDN